MKVVFFKKVHKSGGHSHPGPPLATPLIYRGVARSVMSFGKGGQTKLFQDTLALLSRLLSVMELIVALTATKHVCGETNTT